MKIPQFSSCFQQKLIALSATTRYFQARSVSLPNLDGFEIFKSLNNLEFNWGHRYEDKILQFQSCFPRNRETSVKARLCNFIFSKSLSSYCFAKKKKCAYLSIPCFSSLSRCCWWWWNEAIEAAAAPPCAKNGKLFSANPKADWRLAFNASLYIDGFGAKEGLLALKKLGNKKRPKLLTINLCWRNTECWNFNELFETQCCATLCLKNRDKHVMDAIFWGTFFCEIWKACK